MSPNWKPVFAAGLALFTAFGGVLGCGLVKKSFPAGAAELSLDARAEYYFSEAIQLSLAGKLQPARMSLLQALALDPDSPYLHFKLAQLYALSANSSEAVKEAGLAVKLDPSWNEPYFFLADSYMMAGRPDLAEPYARKLKELAPGDPLAARLLSRVYELKGRMDEAVSALGEFAEQNPAELELRKEYARILIRAGRPLEAEKAFLDLLEYAPGDAGAWSEYAQLELHKGDVSEALSALSRELELAPDNLADRMTLVKLLVQTGSRSAAHEQLERAKVYARDNPDPWLYSGYLYLEEGVTELARSEFLAALQLAPKSDSALYQLGLLALSAKNWDEAAKWFARVPADSKLLPEAQARMIWVTYEQGRKEEAISQAQSLTAAHPAAKAFWLALVEIYQQEERWEDAQQTLNEALKQIPEDPDLFYALAIIYSLTGDPARAVEFAQTALNKRPGDPAVLNFIAYTWLEQKQNLDQARDYLQKALELDPENGAILDSMGWLYFQQGNYREALKWISRAQSKMPDDPEIMKHLGQIYRKLGDRAAARLWLQKALKQNPRPALKNQIEGLLKGIGP